MYLSRLDPEMRLQERLWSVLDKELSRGTLTTDVLNKLAKKGLDLKGPWSQSMLVGHLSLGHFNLEHLHWLLSKNVQLDAPSIQAYFNGTSLGRSPQASHPHEWMFRYFKNVLQEPWSKTEPYLTLIHQLMPLSSFQDPDGNNLWHHLALTWNRYTRAYPTFSNSTVFHQSVEWMRQATESGLPLFKRNHLGDTPLHTCIRKIHADAHREGNWLLLSLFVTFHPEAWHWDNGKQQTVEELYNKARQKEATTTPWQAYLDSALQQFHFNKVLPEVIEIKEKKPRL